jgi:hypothetical protein
MINGRIVVVVDDGLSMNVWDYKIDKIAIWNHTYAVVKGKSRQSIVPSEYIQGDCDLEDTRDAAMVVTFETFARCQDFYTSLMLTKTTIE